MYLRFAPIALVAILTGCVSTKIVPVDNKQLAALNGGTSAMSQREKPSFAAGTAGKAMFGALGGAAMIAAGNEIVRDNQIEDPAGYIANKLLPDFAAANGLKLVSSTSTASGTDVAQLAKQYSNVDLLFDVQTINWSFVYFPTNWNHYRVIYSAKLRLIDTKHGKLIADGFCARVPNETPDAPTREELLADHAARLKKELATAADYCIGEFRSKVLQPGAATNKT
jgi:hypothetical protein